MASSAASTGCSFRVLASCSASSARTAAWRGLATPLATRSTVGGSPPYITPDDGAVHPHTIRFSHVFQQADVSHKTGKKMAEYLNLGHGAAPTILTIRDTDAFRPGHNGDNHVSVETASGRRKVTPADYVAAVNKLRPDVVVSMAHEVLATAKRKHQEASVKRNAKWLAQLAEGKSPDIDLFAVVTGGTSLALRRQCALDVGALPGVAGYMLGGFGCGEAANDRARALKVLAATLPATAPRMLVGVDGPWEVLKAVAGGVDLVDSAYAFKLAEDGYACTFPVNVLPGLDEAKDATGSGEGEGDDADVTMTKAGDHATPVDGAPDHCPGDVTKICLADRRFTLDTSPLLEGCTCFTCRRHTRAYVRHLLDAHEMLGHVLLYTHNLHHMDRFMEAIRASLTAGRFVAYAKAYAASAGVPEDEQALLVVDTAAVLARDAEADAKAAPPVAQ